MDIIEEKIEQAIGILRELDADVWMLFVRETAEIADPSFAMVAPAHVVWQSAIIFSRNGERIAIAGRLDAEIFRRSGLYGEVHFYDQSIVPELRQVMARLDPRQIAINYSPSNHTADGLSHGMYLTLCEALRGTPYVDRLVSAEEIVSRLRGRKSPGEVQRVRQAIRATEEEFIAVTPLLRRGRTEKDIADFMHTRLARTDLQPAWDARSCPIVNAGPCADSGHAGPLTSKTIEHGQVVHLDFGVRKDGYCADLQRLWYVRRPGERRAPGNVQRAFDVVCKAIEAGVKALRPGVPGWQVDAVARRTIVEAGYPEYPHAFAHQLGRAAHDGGTILGPRWERYGNTPLGLIEVGNIFTPELSVQTEAGMVGLEENVLVTEHGCEFLSNPQTEIWYA